MKYTSLEKLRDRLAYYLLTKILAKRERKIRGVLALTMALTLCLGLGDDL